MTRRVRWTVILGSVALAAVHVSASVATGDPARPGDEYRAVRGPALNCPVNFRFSNSKSYDIYIDWYESYSRRKGLHAWRRLSNLYLSTDPGGRIPAGGTLRTAKTIEQICRSNVRFRLRLRTDRDGDGRPRETSEEEATLYWPCESCWHRLYDSEQRNIDVGNVGTLFR